MLFVIEHFPVSRLQKKDETPEGCFSRILNAVINVYQKSNFNLLYASAGSFRLQPQQPYLI